jgi:hypothetical protein
MPDILIADTTPGQQITELFVWVAINPDGSEGICSADIEIPGHGSRHMPMMTSQRRLLPSIKSLKERLAEMADDQGLGLRYELRRFIFTGVLDHG